MAEAATSVPVSNGTQGDVFEKEEAPSSNLTNSAFFLEAAGLLALWSLLVINEGAIRLIDSNPAAGFDDDGRPPRFVVFLGGLLEVAFGMIGVFVGVAGFILRYYNTAITKLSMVIQTLFGYYVFIVYVFLIPAYRAADLTEPVVPGLSIGESRFLITMGILTSFHFCLALQGGQFVFFARLVCGGTGADFLKQRSGNGMRAVFWNVNLALSGLWTLITGAVLNSSVGGGKLDGAFVFPPSVGRLPGLTIWTGVLMIVYGVAGMGMSMTKMQVPGLYYLFGGYVYLSAFLNFTIVQFGVIDGAPAGPVALHAGLVFMTVFIGPYFVHLASVDNKKQNLP